MGVFPAGARLIPNPYNKIPGFSVGHVHFVPGFPVMAWPMIEWVLDQHYAHLFRQHAYAEKSVIVFGVDGSHADAADGGDRARSPRRQGVQPAQRRPSGIRPPHRPGRQGRARPGRRRPMLNCWRVFRLLSVGLGPELVR